MDSAADKPIQKPEERSDSDDSRSAARTLRHRLERAWDQTKILLRFLKTERGKLAIPALCIVLPLVGGLLLFQAILAKMLRDDAQNTSGAWVSALMERNPPILSFLCGAPLPPQTMHRLEESSRVGDIYRLRIWNAAGDLLFKSERMPSPNKQIAPKEVRRALASRSIVNEVHQGTAPGDVPFYVQSFVPVKQDGEVFGVFEIYLDQTADEALYKKSLLLTDILFGGLLLLACAVPAYFVYRQMLKVNEAKAETRFLAGHDSLTGIPNRRLLGDLVQSALASNHLGKKQLAVLMIDMDRFKDINDTFGHSAGDKVLKAAARRIQSAILEVDTVARFGGDEFVVLQVGMYQPNAASFLADHLVELLAEPYDIGGAQVPCAASIGIAISPADGNSLDALIACADVALSRAKAGGRRSVRFFEPGMDAKTRQRRDIEMDIRRALDEDAFRLVYQPIHRFRDGRLLGFEALLRWPEGWSPKSPADFIPVAEEAGLMDRIGTWALERACKTAASWTNPLKVSVNLSPTQFRDGNIAAVVKQALRSSGLDPGRLELEVTESLWIQDTDSVLQELGRIRKMGVSIALDDFGTGHSSLAYLWKFPFDTLKIDQSFVREMESDPKAAEIVKTIAALGRTLNLTITAEGVERASQARTLRDAGCDQAQGYLFGRPMGADAATALAHANPVSTMTDPEPDELLAS